MGLSDMPAWMGALPDALTLSEILMPGSHDAGVYREVSTKAGFVPIPKSWTTCQSTSVLEQCEAGSRFFDVRLKVSSTSIRAHHTKKGQGALGECWDSTLESVASFLEAHPSECVILRLTKPAGAESDRIIERLLESSLTGRLVKSPTFINFATTPIGSLRGKAICAFEPKHFSTLHPSFGMHPFFRYEDGPQDFGLVTCGKYSNSSKLQKVIDGQVAKIDAHADHVGPHLFVLYWTQTWGNVERNTKALPTSADRQRARISGGAHHNMDHLKDMVCLRAGVSPGSARIAATDVTDRRTVMPNVIMCDFVNPATCREIVALNADGLRAHVVSSTP